MEGIKKWLTANPIVAVALRYAVPPVLAGIVAAVGLLGLIPAGAAEACRAALAAAVTPFGLR